jgi:hypothetical protein
MQLLLRGGGQAPPTHVCSSTSLRPPKSRSPDAGGYVKFAPKFIIKGVKRDDKITIFITKMTMAEEREKSSINSDHYVLSARPEGCAKAQTIDFSLPGLAMFSMLEIMSIGTGNTMVLLFSAAILFSVWR